MSNQASRGTGFHLFDHVTHLCHFCMTRRSDAINGEWNCKPVMTPVESTSVMPYAMNVTVEQQRLLQEDQK